MNKKAFGLLAVMALGGCASEQPAESRLRQEPITMARFYDYTSFEPQTSEKPFGENCGLPSLPIFVNGRWSGDTIFQRDHSLWYTGSKERKLHEFGSDEYLISLNPQSTGFKAITNKGVYSFKATYD